MICRELRIASIDSGAILLDPRTAGAGKTSWNLCPRRGVPSRTAPVRFPRLIGATQAEAVRLPDKEDAHKTVATAPKFSEGASSAQKFRSTPSLAES
jgi:hypothetical protein